ncbi:L,D-transpeptidase [Microvirga pudoricolor]|uniref:L,D-transpeptidase n=1 Tax=Microvirga pudoricolor TaxID=2778729 RepID=UPI001E6047B5|nr:L,D-transpeptidase [Microvirga pudoricolor]
MLSRRSVVLAFAAGSLASIRHARAQTPDAYFSGSADDSGFEFRSTNMSMIPPEFRRQLVPYAYDLQPGSIVVDTQAHHLYRVLDQNTALRYGVGVGREGFQWFGSAQVMRKATWPNWTPPPEMLQRQPDIPHFMKGGPDNPLGPRAMYLYRDGRDLLYRIHGTTEPWTIGTDVSSGCIRMLNEDVIDLFQRTPTGTPVFVLKQRV